MSSSMVKAMERTSAANAANREANEKYNKSKRREQQRREKEEEREKEREMDQEEQEKEYERQREQEQINNTPVIYPYQNDLNQIILDMDSDFDANKTTTSYKTVKDHNCSVHLTCENAKLLMKRIVDNINDRKMETLKYINNIEEDVQKQSDDFGNIYVISISRILMNYQQRSTDYFVNRVECIVIVSTPNDYERDGDDSLKQVEGYIESVNLKKKEMSVYFSDETNQYGMTDDVNVMVNFDDVCIGGEEPFSDSVECNLTK